MITELTNFKSFRRQLFALFPKRRDAVMNLLDALTANGHLCRSVVQLSEAKQFERQYSSITDAIADGLTRAKWKDLESLVYQTATQNHSPPVNRFLLDCTSNPRPFARTLEDRSITHAPNPAPGNKPIAVGHQYSLLALLPDEPSDRKNHWLVPLSVLRVKSEEKGNEAGMKQLLEYIDDNHLSNQLNIGIADSLYSSRKCRAQASAESSLVTIVRLNSRRNVFFTPQKFSSPRGRKKEFGEKMKLNKPETHRPCHEKAQTTWVTRKGVKNTVIIECWNNMLIRGSRDFHAASHPFRLIKVSIENPSGESVFKKPLWLAVTGKRHLEVSLIDTYDNYRSRYDIEHFFRFGKQKLLMGNYQTADVDHEELWWKLCSLAYTQLYLARNHVAMSLHRWEEYLPQYKEIHHKPSSTQTPTQTQRGFAKLLDEIGTPAAKCVARGRAAGRMTGESQDKRPKQDIIFKTKKLPQKSDQEILSTSEKTPKNSDPQTIEQLLKSVRQSLGQINLSPTEFVKLLLNPG